MQCNNIAKLYDPNETFAALSVGVMKDWLSQMNTIIYHNHIFSFSPVLHFLHMQQNCYLMILY